jgi:hypothetical protein
MLISKAFYRHLPIFLNLFKCPLQCLICILFDWKSKVWVETQKFQPLFNPTRCNPQQYHKYRS